MTRSTGLLHALRVISFVKGEIPTKSLQEASFLSLVSQTFAKRYRTCAMQGDHWRCYLKFNHRQVELARSLCRILKRSSRRYLGKTVGNSFESEQIEDRYRE